MDTKFYTDKNSNPFLWFACYNNGTLLEEKSNNKITSFSDIPKDDIKQFGFYGMGMKLWLDLTDGYFYTQSDKNPDIISSYNIYLRRKNEKNIIKFIPLFNKDDFNLIQLKHLSTDISPKNGNSKSITDQFIFGFTSHPKDNDIPFTVSIKCIIDIGDTNPGIYNSITIGFDTTYERNYALEAVTNTGSIVTIKTIDCSKEKIHKGLIQLTSRK